MAASQNTLSDRAMPNREPSCRARCDSVRRRSQYIETSSARGRPAHSAPCDRLRMIAPICLDRIPELLQSLFVGVVVLHDEAEDAMGMLQRQSLYRGSAVGHYVLTALLPLQQQAPRLWRTILVQLNGYALHAKARSHLLSRGVGVDGPRGTRLPESRGRAE